MIKDSFKEFAKSTPLQKVSTIADFATILGISVTTFVAGPYLSRFFGLGFDLAEFLWALLFYSFFTVILLWMFSDLVTEVNKKLNPESELINEDKKNTKEGWQPSLLTSIFITVLFATLTFSFLPTAKDFFGDITSNRYLLPFNAEKAIENINQISIKNNESSKTSHLQGAVEFKENMDFDDYTAVMYQLDNTRGVYKIYNYEYDRNNVPLNESGMFSFPIKDTNNLSDTYIVVYRKLDSNRLSGDDYPNNITLIPSSEMEKIGAFSKHVDLRA